MADEENKEDSNKGTIKCPGCDVRLPEDDIRAQMDHMDKNHPEIIKQRLNEKPY